MVRIRVKVLPPDEDHPNAYHVHLPTYFMIPNSWKPVIIGKTHNDGVLPTATLTPAEQASLTVEVEVPDDECVNGKPDKAKIRKKYHGQPRWDREDILGDV